MKKILLLSLALAACSSAEGISKTSSKPPRGNPNSSILVEEYADLQCPACRGAHGQIVLPLLEKYGRNIRYEFQHFPLRQIHAFAQEAAEAAECAADQGKFWEFVDHTYEHQENISRDDLIARAITVGVTDTDLFERCVRSRAKRDAVQAEYEEGRTRDVRGTPTFFVAGEKVPSNTLNALGEIIEQKMRSQRL